MFRYFSFSDFMFIVLFSEIFTFDKVLLFDKLHGIDQNFHLKD